MIRIMPRITGCRVTEITHWDQRWIIQRRATKWPVCCLLSGVLAISHDPSSIASDLSQQRGAEARLCGSAEGRGTGSDVAASAGARSAVRSACGPARTDAFRPRLGLVSRPRRVCAQL